MQTAERSGRSKLVARTERRTNGIDNGLNQEKEEAEGCRKRFESVVNERNIWNQGINMKYVVWWNGNIDMSATANIWRKMIG